MKKFYALLLSFVLAVNGSFATVFAEGTEPQTEEPTQEAETEQPEEIIEEGEPAEEETIENEEVTEEPEGTVPEEEVISDELKINDLEEKVEEGEEDSSVSEILNANSYPLIGLKKGIADKEYSVGTTILLEFVYFPVYYDEQVDITIRDSNGVIKGASHFDLDNRNRSVVNLEVSWDTKGYSPGIYFINGSSKYYKSYMWYDTPSTYDCNYSITLIGSNPTPTPSPSPTPTFAPTPTPSDSPDACKAFGFCHINGKDYWYENSKRQAVPGDPKNLIDVKYHVERGREIYDPETNAWYWLDSVYDGAKATGKEVWMPYIYQEEDSWSDADKVKLAQESDPGMADCVLKAMQNKDGKWVRYDGSGKMLKGWVTITGDLASIYPEQRGNIYYYDTRTGLMAKGWVTIEGRLRHFDEVTGVLQ